MNSNNPFSHPGRWYRGNTHLHSTVSDGKRNLAECWEGYKKQGYDFLVVTDHNRISDVASCPDNSFLVISGCEYNPPNPYGGKPYHIVAINVHDLLDFESRHPNELMRDISKQGGISVLAHPYWSGHTLLDMLPLDGFFAIEVFNTTCDKNGRSFSESHWDDLLDKNIPVFGIASDDSHAFHDLYQGWVMVKCSELTAESIVESLRSGLFYSTQGPEIFDFHLEESEQTDSNSGKHTVKRIAAVFSPSVSVVFKSSPCRGKHLRAQNGKLITEAFFDIEKDEKYIRLEITAPDGKKAWSQPIILGAE